MAATFFRMCPAPAAHGEFLNPPGFITAITVIIDSTRIAAKEIN
jgi:hypothetical protein